MPINWHENVFRKPLVQLVLSLSCLIYPLAIPSLSDSCKEITCITGDKLNMAVFFWYLVKNDLSIVRYCTCVH